MANRFSYVPNRVIDQDGISDGATISVFDTGTTTPLTIYSDEGLTTPISNPVTVASGAAVPPIYYADADTARVQVAQSDGTIISDDDPYEPSATGTVDLSPSGTAATIGSAGGSNVQADIDALEVSAGAITVPDQTDFPFSLYIGDVDFSGVTGGGGFLGHNILIGQDILSASYTATDATNPDTGYGQVMIGTRIGSQKMTNNRDNVLIGYETALNLGNCDNVVALGAKALYSNSQTAETANTVSPRNGVAIGVTAFYEGLTATTTGFVGIGTNVGRNINRAFECVYIGEESGFYLTATLYNTAVGSNTLGGETDQSATNTINNVAIGWFALSAHGDGTQNIAVGSNAGRGVTTGGRNVLIGHGAGSDISAPNGAAGSNAVTTGSFNTLIGNETEVSSATAQYQVAIGAGAACTADNQITLGDTGRDHQVVVNGYLKQKIFTVNGPSDALPNAATVGAGSVAFVSDTTLDPSSNYWANTAGTGGGSNFAQVVSDGSAWRIG